MKSDRSRQCAWTMAVLQASLACAACAGGNNEVLAPDDAATPSVADSGAGTPPDAGQAVPDAGSASGGDDSGPAGSPVTGDDGGADGGGVTSTGGGDSGAGSACTNPTCVVSTTGCTEGNYYLYDHQWNCPPTSGVTCGPETLYGCSYNSWYVTSNQPAGNTEVLTFPSVQENFDSNPLVSSFHTITSTFAETSPHVGDYEVAYDIWLNDQKNELMIWVDNYKQTPAGKKVASSVSLGGRTYDVWWSSGSGYIVFDANNTFTSGTVDILQMFNYAIQQTWLPSTSTLGQINLGVEVCSTDGKDATWYFNRLRSRRTDGRSPPSESGSSTWRPRAPNLVTPCSSTTGDVVPPFIGPLLTDEPDLVPRQTLAVRGLLAVGETYATSGEARAQRTFGPIAPFHGAKGGLSERLDDVDGLPIHVARDRMLAWLSAASWSRHSARRMRTGRRADWQHADRPEQRRAT